MKPFPLLAFTELVLRPVDLGIIAAGLVLVVAIGFWSSRRNVSGSAYFSTGGRMPGWAVGFSLMATLVSSSSFLALPEFSYMHDWRFLGTCLAYPIALWCAWRWFMPFYRRAGFNSAYEYFEQRFGLWVRLYVAFGFVMFAFLKMGLVLYGSAVALGAATGVSVPLMIVIFGIIVVLYTVVGGLEAVIWTDVIQGSALLIGAIACVPVILGHLPGGLHTLIADGVAGDKFALDTKEWHWVNFGLLVIVLGNFFDYLRMVTTDQMFVQRYVAPRSERDARITLAMAGVGSVLVWVTFTFIGTALWSFYQHVPDERVGTLNSLAVFPHFLITQLPAGLAGFVFFGLIMAAMSTLDSSINAIAQTVSTDFYKRLLRPEANEQHLLRVGQAVSVIFGVLMLAVALYVHYSRTTTLQELQNILTAVFGSGLAGLFLLGFTTRQARYLPVLATTGLMVVGVILWLTLSRTTLRDVMPHPLWLAVFTNIFVYAAGLALSALWPKTRPASPTHHS